MAVRARLGALWMRQRRGHAVAALAAERRLARQGPAWLRLVTAGGASTDETIAMTIGVDAATRLVTRGRFERERNAREEHLCGQRTVGVDGLEYCHWYGMSLATRNRASRTARALVRGVCLHTDDGAEEATRERRTVCTIPVARCTFCGDLHVDVPIHMATALGNRRAPRRHDLGVAQTTVAH